MPWRRAVLNTQFIKDFLQTSKPEDDFTLSSDGQHLFPPNNFVFPPAESSGPYSAPILGATTSSDSLSNSWAEAPRTNSLTASITSTVGTEDSYFSSPKRVKAGPTCWSPGCYDPVHSFHGGLDPPQDMYGYQARCKSDHAAPPQENARWSFDSQAYPEPIHKTPEFPTFPSARIYDSRPTLAPSSLKRPSDTSTDQDTFSERQNKASHNQVERKYRENLNSKFELLRKAIPSMQTASSGKIPCDGADVEQLAKNHKPRKAEILALATIYMKQMEDNNRLLREEVESLRARNQELEKNTRCESCWLRNEFGNLTFEGLTDWAEHNHIHLGTMERRLDCDNEEPSTTAE
ncbi:hypothetical protein MMC18_003941 [Xylographa bjoerkii]|nr:hypothetical protein [Xylographa bjoerkii]